MTDDDLPSVTGGPPTPRMPLPPTDDEPKGIVATLFIATVDAAVEAYLPLVVFLVLGAILGLALW